MLLFGLFLVTLLLTVATDKKSDFRIEQDLSEHAEVAIETLSNPIKTDSLQPERP